MASKIGDPVVSGWRGGAAMVDGLDNPAGPLFVGGEATELDLVEVDFAALTACSSCTGSRPVQCC